MTTINGRSRGAIRLLWVHAGLFAVIAVASYVSPQTVFGESAWLPLSRLAVLLFAAVLLTMAVIMGGNALLDSPRQVRLAVFAALAIDVQVPILMFSQPASLEYLESGLGIPWFLVPLTFLVMVGLTVRCLLGMRREMAGV